MRKVLLVLVFLATLPFIRTNNIYAAVEACEVLPGGGTVNCTVCKWENNSCVVDESQSTCSNSGYITDPDVCNEPTSRQECEGGSGTPWAGQCKESDQPPPPDQGFKYVGSTVDPNICVRCNRGLPDTEGDNAQCKYDTKQICIESETSADLYKCSNNKCEPCSDQEQDNEDCKARYRCEAECGRNTFKNFDNTPLSQPCPNGALDNKRGCTRINTAFGNIPTEADKFARWILGFFLSLAGGIVVLIIIITGYKLMTSQGDPEKVKNAREQLTAAIVGLLFIIFSLVILEFITRDILGLPGFGR